jgi:hypothetical protein
VKMTVYEKMKSYEKAFDQNVARIERCLEHGLKEVAVILIVSTFESFLRDMFVLRKAWWFLKSKSSLDMLKPETRKEIRGYLQDIGAYDEFLRIRYMYSEGRDPDITSLYEVLFPEKGREKINFQNLTRPYGVKVAYETFFKIDLLYSLDETSSTSDRRWETLIKLFYERHKIVHRGNETTFSKEDIDVVLESIKYLKRYLIKKLGPYDDDGRFVSPYANDEPENQS